MLATMLLVKETGCGVEAEEYLGNLGGLSSGVEA
jgi:hypothetical protein